MPTTASIRINGGTAGLADTDLPLGTVVNLSNNDNTGVVSYEWVIVSQPAGAQDNLNPHVESNPIVSTDPAPQFTPTKEGSYLIKLTVNKGLADESVGTTICAVRELQTGDRIPAPQETTEVSDEEGWATTAVTKILQRVTRMSDAGIFVAQNASGVSLALGKVVHMNGMSTLGTGSNERPIPTVGLALANDVALVDGPLGVVVGDRDGDNLPVAVGALCRVMVMGGISSYDLGDTAAAGDPVFVDDLGNLSLTAGSVVRQVGDVAKLVSGTTYDIAISAGANSIPRGNAGGDLGGRYPDPTVAGINGTLVGTGSAPTKAVGNVLRLTAAYPDPPAAEWGPVDLADTDAVTGALPMDKGGTGNALYPAAGGIVYGAPASKLDITAPAAAAGYFLTSGTGGTGMPTWTQTVPAQSGGTGIAGGYTIGAMLYANGASSLTQVPPTSAGTRGILQSKGTGFAPVWIINGTSGHPLVSKGSGTDAVFEQLSITTGTTGTLPVNRGGTGQSTALIANGLIYASSTTAMASLTLPVASGSVLLGSLSAPYWSQYVPLASGGTNADLSGESTNGVVYKASSTALGVTTATTSGAILSTSLLGVPTWKSAGTAGQILTLSSSIVPGVLSLDWQNFGDYFDAQYATAGSTTIASYTTTSGTYSPVGTVSRSLNKGIVTVACMAPSNGDVFRNTITTSTNGASTQVLLRFTVQYPDSTTSQFTYAFRSPIAHNNNQINGSITFPTLTFYTSQAGTHQVTLDANVTLGHTFTVENLVIRIAQG